MNDDQAMSFDRGYALFLERIEKNCRCCPVCWERPCGSCQQGASCDAMPCRCDNDTWLEDDDGDLLEEDL